jgi:hypothetical protein
LRKVFLDDLPKYSRGYISWKDSIGCKIKFIYDSIDDEFKIIDYLIKDNKPYIKIKYKNKEYLQWIGDIKKCKFGVILDKYNIDYIYKIGDIVSNGICGEMKILEQTKIKVKGIRQRILKGYIYECLNCGDKREKTEDELKRNGCGVCSGTITLKGYNDIHTTHPKLGLMLWNFEDGFKYSFGSRKKVDWRCPDCSNKINNRSISGVFSKGLSCKKCGDGISYPEKIIWGILYQLNINFEVQKTFKWSSRKKYDFYIASHNCIIETHGEQHYRYTGFSRSLEDEQENDNIKKDMATNHGIKKYIVIDCRLSELEWIKNSIMNSDLKKLFDLSKIDWLKCEEFAYKSILKVACDLWKSGIKSTTEIEKIIKINCHTVSKYLKIGKKLGWCDYTVEEAKKLRNEKAKKSTSEAKSIAIVQMSLEGKYIREFKNITEAAKCVNLTISAISNACNGKSKSSGGFLWLTKEEYEKSKENIKPYTKNVINNKRVVRLSLNGEYIDEFISATEAQRQIGISQSTISECCRGIKNKAGGFKWMFKEDYETYIIAI